MDKASLVQRMKTWRRLLEGLHPNTDTVAEKHRIEIAAAMFAQEARVAMIYLIDEVTRAHASEEKLASDLRKTQYSLSEANRLLEEARAKNAKLRAK